MVIKILYILILLRKITNKALDFQSNHELEFKGITFVGDKYCPEIKFSSQESKLSLNKLSQTGAEWIALVVTEYQDYLNTTEIFPIYSNFPKNDYYTYKTETLEGIIEMIKEARKLNLKIMLKPHIDPINIYNETFDWRGNIGTNMSEENKNEWFLSYEQMMIKYAKVAQDFELDMLSIGCELITMSKYDKDWRRLIRSIRQIYKGKLTNAANYGGEEFNKTWWDALDYIGVDAYYLPSNFSEYLKDDLLEQFYKPILVKLANLSETFKRDIIITEVGFCSAGCKRNLTANLTQQINFGKIYYEFYRNFAKEKFIKGIFWWAWNSDPYFGGMDDPCISPQHKITENVLRFIYRGNQSEATLVPDGKPSCKCTV